MRTYQEIQKEVKGGMHPVIKTDFTNVYCYSEGKCVWSGSLAEYNNQPKEIKELIHEKVFNEEEYTKAIKEYRELEQKAFDIWKKEVFEEAGATLGNPQHEALWGYIYQDKHSYIQDVAYAFIEAFEEIIEPFEVAS